MTVISEFTNQYKYRRDIGEINLVSDTIKAILMKPEFAFNKRTHSTLADVTADQVATGNGYTQDTHEITNKVVTKDDTEDASIMTCNDLTILASGGQIEEFGSVCFYDDTTSDDTIVGCTDFGFSSTISESIADGVVTEDGNTLTSASASWTVDELANKGVTIASGFNAGTYTIVSNTATVITIAETFPAAESALAADIYDDITYIITDGTGFQLRDITFKAN